MENGAENEATPSGGSKKWLVIGGVIIAVLLIGGFGMRSMRFGPSMVPPGVEVDQNMDGSVTYSTDEGSVTVGTGGSMPSNWPSDAPSAFTGATIVYSGTNNPATGQAGSAVSYTVNAPVADVVAYYEAGLNAAGWTILSTTEAGGMRVISAQKDTRMMGIYVGSDGEGTTSVTAGIQM